MVLKSTDYYRGALFVLSLLLVGVFWSSPLLLLIGLTGILVEVNRSLDWKFIKTSLLCAVLGPIAEIIAIAFGAWAYTESQIFGVNFWLAPLWGIATLFFISLSRLLGENFEK
jgi:hypothetical protein